MRGHLETSHQTGLERLKPRTQSLFTQRRGATNFRTEVVVREAQF